MFAYSFPLLSVFWTMFLFFVMLSLVFMIIWCFIDNFRRRDHHGLAKVAWTIFILFVPIVGALVYIFARPANVAT